jgi:photosystem II stability/assembly factor-like uncharacterized protein
MKTKNIFQILICTIILLLNPILLHAQWDAVRYDQHNTFQSIAAPSANTVFVTGVDPIGEINFILKTNDAGITWDSISFNTANDFFVFTKINFIDVNTGFVSGTKNNNQLLLKTTDNGISWIDITPNPSTTFVLSSVSFADIQHGFATDIYFFYTTMDGGNTWTTVNTNFNMRGLHFNSMNSGFAAGDEGSAVIKQTNNAGQSWNTVFSAMDSNLFVSSFNKMDFIDASVGFSAIENSNKFFRTVNGGSSWQSITVDSARVIRDFDFISADTGHVLAEVGWSQEFRILYTVDGGQNWTKEYTTGWNFYGAGVTLNSFAFVEQTGYSAGSQGLVKKYSPNIAGLNAKKMTVSTSIFPNPFSNSAILQIANWDLLKKEQVQLKIYNAIGLEVFHTNIKSANYELNRGFLTDGIYFYNIYNGNKNIAQGKLILAN